MPLIILPAPFDLMIQHFSSSNYINIYIKCKGYSSPCLIQVYVFCRVFTNRCDYVPSFDVILVNKYEHRLATFLHQIVLDTYQNNEEIFAKNPASVINIRCLFPSSLSDSPFVTGYIHRYIRITTAHRKRRKEMETNT